MPLLLAAWRRFTYASAMRFWPACLAAMLLASAGAVAAAPAMLFAGGRWAAVQRGSTCEAASRALRVARAGRTQARAGVAFDSGGPRKGQFYALLNRLPREGAAVMLRVGDRPFLLVRRGQWAWSSGPAQDRAILESIRLAAAMQVESRDRAGRRFRDSYSLDGAPTAIDAAAAACAVAKARSAN